MVNFKHSLGIHIFSIQVKMTLERMPEGKNARKQPITWTSVDLDLSRYGVIRLQWVKSLKFSQEKFP